MAPSRRKGPKAAAANRKWNVGELVLAKVKGYRAWPAIVSEPGKWGYPAGLKKVLVCFFGTQEIALCNPADLEEFTEQKKLTLLGKRRGKTAAFLRALNEIIDSFDKLKKQDQVSDDELFGETDTTVENISGYSSTKSFKDEAQPISVQQLSAGVTGCLESITETVMAAPVTDALLDEVMQLEEAHGDLSSTERQDYPKSSRDDATKSGKCNRKMAYLRSLTSSSRVDTHSSDECSTVDLGCESMEGEHSEEQTGLSGRVDFQTSSRAITVKRKANQQTPDTSLVEIRAHLFISEHEMPKRDCEIYNELATLNRCSHQDSDEHLPLAKRARIRMGSHAGDEVRASVHSVHEDEKMVDTNDSTITLSDGALSFKSADMEHIRDLSRTSPVIHEVETLVHEQEEPKVAEGVVLSRPLNYDVDALVDEASRLVPGETSLSEIPVGKPQSVVSINGFTDGESSLPLSKRIHRALEAMSANVAEAGVGAVSCSPCVNAHGDVCRTTCSVECSEIPVRNEVTIQSGIGPIDNDRVGESQESAYEYGGINSEMVGHHGGTSAVSNPEICEESREYMENVENKCVIMSPLSKRPAESFGDQHLKTESPDVLDRLGRSKTCLKSADNSFKIRRTQEFAAGSDPNVSRSILDSIMAEETAADSLVVRCTSMDIFESAVDDGSHEDQHLKLDTPNTLDHLSSATCLIFADNSCNIIHTKEAASESDPNVSHTISNSLLVEETATGSLAVKCASTNILDSAIDDESHADQHLNPDSPKMVDQLGSSTTCLISADNSCNIFHMKEAASGSDPNVCHTISDSIVVEGTAAGSVAVKCTSLDILDSAVDDESQEDRHLKPDSPKMVDHWGSSTTCLISADNSFEIRQAESGSDPNVSCKNVDSILAGETAVDSLTAEKCTSIDILDSAAVDAKNPMKQLLLFENNLGCHRSEFVEQAARSASPDSNGVPAEAAKNCQQRCPSPSASDSNLADVRDTIALVSPPNTSLSSRKVETLLSFEDLVRSLTKSKETIGRATRIAVDCAKYDLASKVVEILTHSLERESRLPKKVALFFLVDSIAQCSHCLKGDCGIYPTIIQPLLPRLLAAAAPPGLSSYENQRQCLKVLRVWLERKILPEPVIRPRIEELDAFCDLYRSSGSRRSFRNERAFDDPVREMEGILVDEYGSNSNIQFPGFHMPPLLSDADEGSDSDGDGFESVTPERNVESLDGGEVTAEVRKRKLTLEDVDGELEMEDDAPCSEFKITATSGNAGTIRDQMPCCSSDEHCALPFASQQFEAAQQPPPPPAHQAPLPDFSHAVHKYEYYKRSPRESRWGQSDLPRINTRSSDTVHRYSHRDQDFEKERRRFPDSRHDYSFGDEPSVHFSDRASNDMRPMDGDFHRDVYQPHSNPTPSRQFSYAPEHRSQRRDIHPHPNRFRPRYAGNSSSFRDSERNRYAPPQSGTGEYLRPQSPSDHGQCYGNGSRMDQVPYPPSYPPSRHTQSGNRRRVPPWLMNRMQVNPGGPVLVGNRGPNNWKSR